MFDDSLASRGSPRGFRGLRSGGANGKDTRRLPRSRPAGSEELRRHRAVLVSPPDMVGEDRAVLPVDVVTLLAVAAGGLIAGRALGLPAIVAYLVAGVLAGPGVLGLVQRSAGLEQVAELGVALLLFGVGIEFSLDAAPPEPAADGHDRRSADRWRPSRSRRSPSARSASLAGRACSSASWWRSRARRSSSSCYDESGEIDAPHGQAAAGILLFQDLALVPMMLLVPVLAAPGEGFVVAASTALAQAARALAVLLVAARVVLPRVLEPGRARPHPGALPDRRAGRGLRHRALSRPGSGSRCRSARSWRGSRSRGAATPTRSSPSCCRSATPSSRSSSPRSACSSIRRRWSRADASAGRGRRRRS